MPFRLAEAYGEFRAKIQFTTAAWMPYKIYEACKVTGVLSNTRYCQIAVCERLAKDLDLDLEDLVSQLPRARGMSNKLFDPTGRETPVPGPVPQGERHAANTRVVIGRYGMGGTDEEVY